MPRIGTDEFPRVIINDGAGHYAELPQLTTTQRDALTAAEGMLIANSTTSTIQGYINGAWRNMDAQMLTAYLPLAGGTMTGPIDMGNRDITKAHYVSLLDLYPDRGIQWSLAGGNFATHNVDNAYVIIYARDSGIGFVEIARMKGAAAAHFLMKAARFGTAAHAADADHRGFLYFTEGAAGVADKLYCIMKSVADTYSAVEVATG